MLEVGLVVGSGSEQHDARVLAMARHETAQGLAIDLEETREPADLGGAKNVAEHARRDQPVFQRVARTGRRLRAIRQHPPSAVGRTRDVGRVGMKINFARYGNINAGAQKTFVAEDEFGRQKIVAQQLARPVEVGKNRVQQRRALLQCGFDSAPFAMVDDQRHRVQGPRAIGGRGVAINVVGDAVVMQQTTPLMPAAEQTAGAD